MRTSSNIAGFFLFLISIVGFAQDAASPTPKSLYDQGKFQDALELLQKSGPRTAADYYNAGNCYYRLGKVGQALSYFEKANVLAPGDDDIQYNLKLARASLEHRGAVQKDQSLWWGQIVPIARRIPETFVDLLVALCTLGLGAICLKARRKKLKFVKAVAEPGFLTVLATWAFACALATTVVMAHSAKIAAVVADLGVARSGPSETFTELFKLPAGTHVELTGESREGWSQIRFSLGNVGWIMEKDLLKL